MKKTLVILIILVLLFITNLFPTFLEILRQKVILRIDDSNEKIIQAYLQQSNSSSSKKDINNIKKIQYYLAFNNDEYTIFYKDGTKDEFIDDHNWELKDYIREHGHYLYYRNIVMQVLLIVAILICLVVLVNNLRKER